MGFDKLSTAPSLHSPDTLLSRAISAARRLNFVVALPAQDHPYFSTRQAILRPYDRAVLMGPADEGISETLKRLARIALDEGYDGLAILMADMPFITPTHVEKLVDMFEMFDGSRIVRTVCPSGKPGYPIIFPASVLPAFAELTGEDSVDKVIADHAVKWLQMPTEAPCMHVNTPEDWRQM